jgi:hypothetical protein
LNAAPQPRRPVHPLLVLPVAILLPGFGHTLLGFSMRGLVFQIFMIMLGWLTWHMSSPDRSLAGRLAGGLFIYAFSIMDAYRLARLRWDAFQRQADDGAGKPP